MYKKKNKKQMKYFKEFSVNEADELNEDIMIIAYIAIGLIGAFGVLKIVGKVSKFLSRFKIRAKWTIAGAGMSKMADILEPIVVRFADDIELVKMLQKFKNIQFIHNIIVSGVEDKEEIAKYGATFKEIWEHIKDDITPEEKQQLQSLGMGKESK